MGEVLNSSVSALGVAVLFDDGEASRRPWHDPAPTLISTRGRAGLPGERRGVPAAGAGGGHTGGAAGVRGVRGMGAGPAGRGHLRGRRRSRVRCRSSRPTTPPDSVCVQVSSHQTPQPSRISHSLSFTDTTGLGQGGQDAHAHNLRPGPLPAGHGSGRRRPVPTGPHPRRPGPWGLAGRQPPRQHHR